MTSPARHRKPPGRHRAQHAAPTAFQSAAVTLAKTTPAAVVGVALLTAQPAVPAVMTAAAGPAPAASLTSFAPPPATSPAVTPAIYVPYPEQIVQDWRPRISPVPPAAEQQEPTGQVVTDALVVHHGAPASSKYYRVVPGDTLSGIAQRFYGDAGKWQLIYNANRTAIADPNMIVPGMVLSVPAVVSIPPAQATTAKTAATATTRTAPDPPSVPSGTLSCAGLEQLWDVAGGAPGEAHMAAEIAQAESSGDQFAHSPTGDVGYWQINAGAHPGLATTDPAGNARAAIAISGDGSSWDAWTTFINGAYQGKC